MRAVPRSPLACVWVPSQHNVPRLGARWRQTALQPLRARSLGRPPNPCPRRELGDAVRRNWDAANNWRLDVEISERIHSPQEFKSLYQHCSHKCGTVWVLRYWVLHYWVLHYMGGTGLAAACAPSCLPELLCIC